MLIYFKAFRTEKLILFLILDGLSFIEYHDRLGQLINQSTSWSNEKHKITVSNGIFMSQKYQIRGKYTKAAKLVYKSKILKMDFENQSKHCATLINK